MSVENIVKFQEAVAASPELQAKVRAVQEESSRKVAKQIAALSAGTEAPVTADDLLESMSTLSDEALEQVAGGNIDQETAGKVAASVFTLGLACLIMYQNSQKGDLPKNCM